MQTIAIVNEKGGTAKTTTTVNLAACLGRRGHRVLVVDLDGQAATSRWFGVEDDPRLAEALVGGGGLRPIEGVVDNVDLAPASGRIDSVAHELRPTQGGQLRKILAEHETRYDFTLIDCPPSLGNRLIGNALLAASHAIAPVETSILALDGLRMLLTMLGDIRDGFGHDIRLMGILACRYDARTRLSRLVLAELQRTLPDHVFRTIIRSNVKLQEAPAAQQSILEYAPQSGASEDYQSLAREVEVGGPRGRLALAADAAGGEGGEGSGGDAGTLAAYAELDAADRATVRSFRERAARHFGVKRQGSQTPVASKTEVGVDGTAEDRAAVDGERRDGGAEDGDREARSGGNHPAAVEVAEEAWAERFFDVGGGGEEKPGRRGGRRMAASVGGVGLALVGLVAWAVYQSGSGPADATASVASKAGRVAVDATADRQAPAEPMSERSTPAREAASGADERANETKVEAEASGNAAGDDNGAPPAGPRESSMPEVSRTAIADAADAASMMSAMRAATGANQAEDDRSSPTGEKAERGERWRDGKVGGGSEEGAASSDGGDAGSGGEDGRDKARGPASLSDDDSGGVGSAGPASARPMPSTLRLTGTVDRPGGGTAIVNGTVVHEGGRYRGAELVEVGRSWATLSYRGERYRLTVGGPVISVEGAGAGADSETGGLVDDGR